MLDEGSVCPHCKKGIMRMRSAVFDINIPDTGDKKELLCDMSRHRVVTVDLHQNINVRDDAEAKKIPAPPHNNDNQ